MQFNVCFFARATQYALHTGHAWAQRKLAARAAAAQHYDPIAAEPRGPLLSMLTSSY
jgi:hypothetical protein